MADPTFFGFENEEEPSIEGIQTVGGYGPGNAPPEPPAPTPDLTAVSRRMNVIGTDENATSVTIVSGPVDANDGVTEVGRATVRDDLNISYDLITYSGAPPSVVEFVIEKVVDGVTSTETIQVGVTRGLPLDGTVRHGHYMLPLDENGDFIVEPDEETRRVYITKSSAALTEAEISSRHSGAAVTQNFLISTNARNSSGDVQTFKYGEREDYAISEEVAEILWPRLGGARSSNWLLYERGYEYNFSGSFGGSANTMGVDPIHPRHGTAWGTGANPGIKRNKPSVGRVNSVTKFVDVLQPDSPENFTLTFKGGVMIALTSCKVDNAELTTRPDFRTARGVTFHKLNVPGTFKVPEAGQEFYGFHSDRKFSIYSSGTRDLLISQCVMDFGGWKDPYDYYASTALQQPPSQFNHIAYLANTSRGVCIEDCLFARGANTGGQCRQGGVFRNNLFAGSNTNLFVAGGQFQDSTLPGSVQGNFTYLQNNWVTWGAQRRVFEAAQGKNHVIGTGIGINNQTPQAVAIGNVVSSSGTQGNGTGGLSPDTDPPIAPTLGGWGSSASGPGVTLTKRGSWDYTDTKEWNWYSDPAVNVEGINEVILNSTSLKDYGETVLGLTGIAIEMQTIDYIMQSPDPVGLTDTIRRWALGRFFSLEPQRAGGRVCIFRPNVLKSPGWHWSNWPDWVDGAIPGDVSGDSVQLWGHRTKHYKTPANDIVDIDFGGGSHTQNGGRVTFTNGVRGGGDLITEDAGQVFMSGNIDELTNIEVKGGRFANTGSLTGIMNLIVRGRGQGLLGWNTSSLSVASGGTIDIRSPFAKVGCDGLNGDTFSLTFETGSKLKLAPAVEVDLHLTQNSAPNLNEIFEGQTSNAKGKVALSEFYQRDDGLILLEDLTGTFQNGEAFHRVETSGGTTTDDNRGDITTVTSPSIRGLRKFFSGYQREDTPGDQGFAPTSQVFNVTIESGVNCEIDLTGLTIGRYNVVESDSVTGTFNLVTTGTLASGTTTSLEYNNGLVELVVE